VLNFQCLVFGLYFIFLTFFPSSYLEFFCKLTNNSQNSQYLIAVDALRHFGVCFLMLGFISRTCVHIKEVSLRERVSSVFALCFVLWGAVAIYVQCMSKDSRQFFIGVKYPLFLVSFVFF